mmetsp:Transcript_4251/g.11110  ORF Transcript_4251/g.11110 Transcript_4251/m.11110 type:complete len:104 (-) Transcript_4251:1727-2038(-)
MVRHASCSTHHHIVDVKSAEYSNDNFGLLYSLLSTAGSNSADSCWLRLPLLPLRRPGDDDGKGEIFILYRLMSAECALKQLAIVVFSSGDMSNSIPRPHIVVS